MSFSTQGIDWAFAGGHMNPAVTFGLFLARELSLSRAVFYIVMQCLGAICVLVLSKGSSHLCLRLRMEVPMMSSVVTPREMALVLRLLVLLFLSTVSYALLMPREMPDSHVPILAVFLVLLATIVYHRHWH